MDEARDPFSPGAGTQPPELAGRTAILDRSRVILERIKTRKHDRSYLLVGLRGVGKTVLLNRIQALAEQDGYFSAFLEAPEEKALAEILAPPLRQLLLKLDRIAGTKDKLHKALAALRAFAATFEIKIGDIGVGVRPEPGVADSGRLDNDLADLLAATAEAAAERRTSVALLIDELQYVKSNDLAALLAGLHRIGQLNLPLVVFGAGLPQLVGLTGKAKSYAERLFIFEELGPLGAKDATEAIEGPIRREGVGIAREALTEIVQVTEGYPFFLQEWGSHAWRVATKSPITPLDVAVARKSAVAALDQGFFRVRFDRLTPSERDYLRAMAELGRGPHRSGDIAAKLNRPVEQVAPIRAGVIAKGMAYAPSHGGTAFTVPMFDDYLRRVMPEFAPKVPRKRTRR
ncbi:MAG TPA: ATP-binding protein [Rhizomicrobium sp.]|jgi:hypothetical protein